jgi:hypothetical protein
MYQFKDTLQDVLGVFCTRWVKLKRNVDVMSIRTFPYFIAKTTKTVSIKLGTGSLQYELCDESNFVRTSSVQYQLFFTKLK